MVGTSESFGDLKEIVWNKKVRHEDVYNKVTERTETTRDV